MRAVPILLLALALCLCGPPSRAFAQASPSIVTLSTSTAGAATEVPAADGETAPDVETVPPICGTQPISIASMQWPSAQVLAEIHALILVAQFGCEVQVVAGDTAATGSSMSANGEPAVAPELWISRIAEIWNQEGRADAVRQAGVTFAEPTLEGWFIPDYVAAAHPELTTASALAEAWVAFAEGNRKGQFISCPVDWGCAVINANLLKALGLGDLFEVVEPANRFELDTLIASAVSRKEPVLFYYWQPNAVLAQFAFKKLDLGAYDHDAFLCLGRRACPDPKPSDFAPEPVAIAVADWVFTETPEVAAYFQRARLPVAEMNSMLAELSEPGATAQNVAKRFVTGREEVWRPWVGEAAGQ